MRFASLGHPSLRCFVARAVVSIAMLLSSMGVIAQSLQDPWVSMKNMRGLSTFDMGESVAINGLPMKMRGFVSGDSAKVVANQFRNLFGARIVENTIGANLVLGKPFGTNFISVQIESTPRGSRGVMALADLKGALQSAEHSSQTRSDWLNKLPAGTSIHSSMKSTDGTRVSHHLVYSNGHGEAFNAERLRRILDQEGLSFERESTLAGGSDQVPEKLDQARTLLFRGQGKDAMSTIHRQGMSRTMVVVNMTSFIERIK